MPRYINADGKYFPTKYRMNTSSYAKGWNACIDSILQCSTADVQEVRHGHWITRNEGNPFFMFGECSECGFGQSLSAHLNFCPNCGAKMGGKGEKNAEIH